MSTLRYLRGSNLLELMVTVSVLTISLTMGVPAFSVLRSSIQRSQAGAELLSSFALARSEAARRGVPVTVCPSTNGSTCDSSAALNWSKGWIVFSDVNMNKVVDSSTDVIFHTSQFGSTALTIAPECISGACTIAAGVTFRDSGYPNESDIGRLRYTEGRQYQVLTLNFIGRIDLTASGTQSP